MNNVNKNEVSVLNDTLGDLILVIEPIYTEYKIPPQEKAIVTCEFEEYYLVYHDNNYLSIFTSGRTIVSCGGVIINPI